MSQVDDIFVIGGGINGCGIARDAAGRGHPVRLAEMNDLASGTSPYSSKHNSSHSKNVCLVQGSHMIAPKIHDDVDWRRSKPGIRLDKNQVSAIGDWIQQKIASDQCSES